MTLAQTVHAMLNDVTFTAPVTVDDCTTVRDALRAALPAGTLIEVHHRYTTVYVRVDDVRREFEVTP